MSTTYPATKQTFSDPSGNSTLDSPDHAGLHTDINDTVEAIQDTIGTTAGTAILKNVLAGQFAATTAGTETLTNKDISSATNTYRSAGTSVIGAVAVLDEDDMVSDSATKVPSQQSVKAYVDASGGSTDGWYTAGETWTRTGNYTFTVSGDVTAKYSKGTRIKYDDGAVDYGIVLGSSHAAGTTTVTLFTNGEYAMASATITDNYYSYQLNPQGFPVSFTWTPSYGATGSMTWTSVTTNKARFTAFSNRCFINLTAVGTTGGTASTGLTFTTPGDAISSSSAYLGAAKVVDTTSSVGFASFVSSASTVQVRKYDASNYGLGAAREVDFTGFYEF